MHRTLLFALLSALALRGETLAEVTAKATKLDGYFPLYWDPAQGKLYLEIPRFDQEFLYVDSLPGGLGQNDLSLDRGQTRGSRIVRFERVGSKVLLVEPNYGFRTSSADPNERRSVEQSFPQGVRWGFAVKAEENGRVLVDATTFFLRDASHVAEQLIDLKQGAYKFDESRSAIYLPATKNFPRNTEVESSITLTAESPGRLVQEVSPDAHAVTLREHFSFIELPGAGYTPRPFDPRAGYFDLNYFDFGTRFSEPVVRRVLQRHRLQAGGTIQYYVDPGIPEPLRSAVLEGARWWSQAFAAAGFPNGFKVDLLPTGADPMDVRYNVIQWANRNTRGWSYGETIPDPRTGEIIKGIVTLGSLRARQDYMIAESLLAPYESGTLPSAAAEQMVLARIRQLAAHEVGHTLGLSHNYAASIHNRSSVMDYPHPLVELGADGTPSLGNAYATGIGDWDKVAIAYGYSATNDRAALEAILKKSIADGLVFLSDEDARPFGSASPLAHLWDNGADPVAELRRLLEVRRKALDRFGERNIRDGAPLSSLEDVLVPVYLLHRYQTEAVAKLVGGADYRYALRGDGQKNVEMVSATDQRNAMDALLLTLRPETLVLPERLLNLIPPTAHGYVRTREDFVHRTGLTFDPLGAAEASANNTIRLILNRERASRLVEQHARDARIPGLAEVIDRLLGATWKAPHDNGLAGEAGRLVSTVALYHLMALSKDDAANMQARAIAHQKLDELRKWLLASPSQSPAEAAHRSFAAARIKQFEDNPKDFMMPAPTEAPPGQPIGEE
jgi:hypothetical protein